MQQKLHKVEPRKMKIKKVGKSSSGGFIINELEINITEEQYQSFLNGAWLHHCAPQLTEEEANFILFGTVTDNLTKNQSL